jgi:hypothetical protein
VTIGAFAHEDPRQPEKESSSRHRSTGEDPLSAAIAQSAGLQCWILGSGQPDRQHRETPADECATTATWSGTL